MAELAILILFLCGIAYVAYQAVLLFFFPDIFKAQMQHAHELEMDRRAAQRQKRGLIGNIFSSFFGK